MRLLRIGEPGFETPAALASDPNAPADETLVVELDDVLAAAGHTDFDERFFGAGGLARLAPIIAERIAAGDVHPLAGRRVGAPIARPHQLLCVGLNYSDHAAESGMPVPDEPILFTKSPNTLVGPGDDVIMPRGATKLDWEVELGIVIGTRASYLASREEAAASIAGYVLVNDVSERAFQLERGGQWLKGKSAETFNPAGPWLVTPDEVDVMNLAMSLDVNGERRQTGSTSTMIFDPLTIVEYISQFMVLEPGDLINTGTPPGVGLGMTPPQYLAVGDVMTLSIEGLGSQHQTVIAARTAGAAS